MTEQKNELERNYINAKYRTEMNQFIRAADQQRLDSHMNGAAMNRCLALIQCERDIERDQREKTDHAGIVNARAEREMTLAQNIEEEKKRTRQEIARRQYLRENDQELKTLAKKLQAAYVCRDVRHQIANKEYRRLQEKAEDACNVKIMDRSIASDREDELRELREDMDKKTSYRRDLRLQMAITNQKEQQRLEQKALDKQMIDDMVKRHHDEDMDQKKKKKENTKKLYCEMIDSLKEQEKWKELKKQQVKEQEDRFKKEQAEARSKSDNLKAERNRIFQEKEAVIRKVAERNLAETKAKEEREEMLLLLQQQLQYEKDLKLDAAEKLKEQMMKTDNKLSLEQQMAIRIRARETEKERNLLYRDQILAMVAAEDKKEFEKELKKKESSKKFATDLKLQLERSRIMKRENRQLDEEGIKNVWRFDDSWRNEVREEREKMIEQHAPHVLGYLQAGVLQKHDMPHVIRGAQKNPRLAHLDVEAMGTGSKPATNFPKCNTQCKILREY